MFKKEKNGKTNIRLQREAIILVFLFVFIVIIILVILFAFSKIQIQIINFRFCSQAQRHINKDYKVVIQLCILGFIPIFKMNITKLKLDKINLKEKMKKINLKALEENTYFNKEILKVLKELNVSIKNINLHIDIGTENASLTSIIVPAISTIIAIVLRTKVNNFKNQIFIVNPIYQNQNLVNLSVSGIFKIRMRNIINIIYMLNRKEKKGVKEHERTSYRRSYDYSYEQYSRYG